MSEKQLELNGLGDKNEMSKAYCLKCGNKIGAEGPEGHDIGATHFKSGNDSDIYLDDCGTDREELRRVIDWHSEKKIDHCVEFVRVCLDKNGNIRG